MQWGNRADIVLVARPPGGLAAGTELTRLVPEWWLMEVVAG